MLTKVGATANTVTTAAAKTSNFRLRAAIAADA
jgi:hypothetical protein